MPCNKTSCAPRKSSASAPQTIACTQSRMRTCEQTLRGKNLHGYFTTKNYLFRWFLLFGDSVGIRLSAIAVRVSAPQTIACTQSRMRTCEQTSGVRIPYIKFATLFGWQTYVGDSVGNRTPVAAVRGLSLNRWTTEPKHYYIIIRF